MTKWMKCDNCGSLQIEPYRLPAEEKAEAWEAKKDQVVITLESDDDETCFDACSWACVAEIALRQSAESVTRHGEGDAS